MPSHRYRQVHDGYHSDGDAQMRIRRKKSHDKGLKGAEPRHPRLHSHKNPRVESPPPLNRRGEAFRNGVAEPHRRRPNPTPLWPRVESPPPVSPDGGRYRDAVQRRETSAPEPKRISYHIRPASPPLVSRTQPSFYPKIDPKYLAPLDQAGYSFGGVSLRRSKSDRTPTSPPAGVQPVQQPWSSTTVTSLPLASGVLGDQAYHYTRLQDLEFRLIKIFPEKKTMVKCEIIHASLRNPPQYVAVSYAWGDAGNTRKIEIGGALIPVSLSLYGALEALREKVQTVMVWADYLCIDQQNRDERTQQVRLMTKIYSKAQSVAIWLGPEEDDSALAVNLLYAVADQSSSPGEVSRLISSRIGKRDLAAVEIYNARSITVYCGSTKASWSAYKYASQAFSRHKGDLGNYFPQDSQDRKRSYAALNQFSYSQILAYQGPGSLPDLQSYTNLGGEALLEVLRACRRKSASDTKDKLFGILGVLPEETRKEFPPNYNLSVKDVYTDIVDYLLKTTECLDVICDAIHFPIHTSSSNLPSYVPDWSHIPQIAAMGHKYSFSAAGSTKANSKFLDERLNKLEISAIYLDTISIHGIAVGTLCKAGDYLMAFLHWRALLLECLQTETAKNSLLVQEAFCRTLSLGQVPSEWKRQNDWLAACHHVFSSLLRERLPHLPLDLVLRDYADMKVGIPPEARRHFLQKHFGDRMMGRCFCHTNHGLIGMGSGFMLPDDLIVVPLGCSTPIILRAEGTHKEFRLVGDVYIDRYMHGRAIDEWKEGRLEVRKYVLH